LRNLEAPGDPEPFPQVGRALVLRFSPDGDRFAAVTQSAAGAIISVFDASDPAAPAVAVSPPVSAAVTTLTWHPSGNWIAIPDHGSAVRRMDAHTGETELIGHHKNSAVRAVFTPDGRWLITGGWEREMIC